MRFRGPAVVIKASLSTLVGTSITITAICVIMSVTAAPLSAQGIPVCSALSYFGQDLVLVCTYEGYFKATNVGWQKLFPPGWGEIKATPDGTIYFYRFETHQVYRSTDGGETWVLMGEAPAADFNEYIFPSPVPDMVFMGVSDLPFVPDVRGIYKSTDGGATWERVLEGGNGNSVAFSPGFTQDGTAFAALAEYHASLGIWKTEDWGETWFPINDGLYVGGSFFGHRWVVVSPQFPQDQTAFTSDWTGLYKTTNGGESWFLLEEFISPLLIVFSPDYIHDQTLLRDEPTGLSLSQDGGQAWQIIHDKYVSAAGIRRPGPFGPPPALLPPPGPHRLYLPFVSNSFAINSPGALEFWVVSQEEYFGDSYLYRSLDYGATWEEVSVYSQLAVAKRADPTLVQDGAPLTYTLRVTNTGSVILHATITDTLPTHIISGTTPGGSAVLPGGTLTWQPVITPTSVGSPGSVWTQQVVVTVETGYTGPLTNVVQVTTVEGATGVYTHVLAPDLDVTKQAHSELVQAGGQLTYTIYVTNTGNFILHTTVTDTLPAHIMPGATPGGSATLPGGTLTWRPVIAAPGVWTETIVVTAETGYAGPLTNVVQVTTVEGAASVYTETVIVIEPQVYLPIVLRQSLPGTRL